MRGIARRIYQTIYLVDKNTPIDWKYILTQQGANRGRLIFDFEFIKELNPVTLPPDASMVRYKYVFIGKKLLRNQEFCEELVRVAKGNLARYCVPCPLRKEEKDG